MSDFALLIFQYVVWKRKLPFYLPSGIWMDQTMSDLLCKNIFIFFLLNLGRIGLHIRSTVGRMVA